jgi:hypothetical protein
MILENLMFTFLDLLDPFGPGNLRTTTTEILTQAVDTVGLYPEATAPEGRRARRVSDRRGC